jgi:8-oxo-dGTP diphosphatase
MSKLQEYLQTSPELTHTVVGYVLTGDQVLLGERKRVSDGLGQSIIAGIGGRLDPGEDQVQALRREIKEEVCLEITAWEKVGQVVCLSPHAPKWNLAIGIYTISEYEGDPQETDEIKPFWFPALALPEERMWPDNLIIIPRILAGQRVVGNFLYGPDGQIAEHELRVLEPDEIL